VKVLLGLMNGRVALTLSLAVDVWSSVKVPADVDAVTEVVCVWEMVSDLLPEVLRDRVDW
jgi:hypothetical protein